MPAALIFLTAAWKSSQLLMSSAFHAGLGEQLLVVEEADLAGVKGNADRLASTGTLWTRGALSVYAQGRLRGDVFEEARLAWARMTAAAPAIDQLGARRLATASASWP